MKLEHELPRLILITDWTLPPERMEQVLGAVLPLGSRVALQHRHPGATGRAFFEEARWLSDRCRPHANPLFINERLDVAILLGAHLHLPAHAAAPTDCRPHLPNGRWISTAVHDAPEAERARGADLALVSPVFSPGSKASDTRAPLGWDGFQRIAQDLPCPAYALGGISSGRLPAGGAPFGLAVVSALWTAATPRAEAERLLAACDETTGHRPL